MGHPNTSDKTEGFQEKKEKAQPWTSALTLGWAKKILNKILERLGKDKGGKCLPVT